MFKLDLVHCFLFRLVILNPYLNFEQATFRQPAKFQFKLSNSVRLPDPHPTGGPEPVHPLCKKRSQPGFQLHFMRFNYTFLRRESVRFWTFIDFPPCGQGFLRAEWILIAAGHRKGV